MVPPTVPPAPSGAKPTRAIRRLNRAWEGQRIERTRKTVYHLPLAALLLHGLTFDSDEGPALDAMAAIQETIAGWLRSSDVDSETVEVSKGTVMMLVRRVDVAMELVRRGAVE